MVVNWGRWTILILAFLGANSSVVFSEDDRASLGERSAAALARAVEFFVSEVSTEGGYLWRYSEDLQSREGEGKADDRTVWVQPPGTPTVGRSLLDAYRATGEQRYLDAAVAAGDCLLRGQLVSGGWDYRIDFDPARRKRYAYRVDGHTSADGLRNTSVLDDDTTQAALRFLMELDRELGFHNEAIHEAARYALESLLAAQYPNGAWPQRYDGPMRDAAKYPVKRASCPETWSWEFPGVQYAGYYTLNDNVLADVVEVMFHAHRVYGDPRYFEAARRGGDFLLLAQMPEPQPAWAQQYDLEMRPAWARKFEPPSVTGGESHGAMATLLRVYRETGDARYLQPIPRALDYLERSQLPDGRLARFYELRTNRPLYFTLDYELTYSDAEVPTHYSFKVSSGIASLRRQYEATAAMSTEQLIAWRASRFSPAVARLSPAVETAARQAVESLDARGRWVDNERLRYHGDADPTRRVIACETFARNVNALSRYLAAVRAEGAAR